MDGKVRQYWHAALNYNIHKQVSILCISEKRNDRGWYSIENSLSVGKDIFFANVAYNVIITHLPVGRAPVIPGLFNQFIYKIDARVMPSSSGDNPHRVKTIFSSLDTLFLAVSGSRLSSRTPPLWCTVMFCIDVCCNRTCFEIKRPHLSPRDPKIGMFVFLVPANRAQPR